MVDFILSGDFKISKLKKGIYKFAVKDSESLENFVEIYGINPPAKVYLGDNEYILTVDSIKKKDGVIYIKFQYTANKFPKESKNGRIYISPKRQFNSCGCGLPTGYVNIAPKNQYNFMNKASLNTNVESGYSAVSFPSKYVGVYNAGPFPGRPQTTPQVAWSYLPPGGGD